MSILRQIILRQYALPYIGGAKYLINNILFYIGVINFGLIAIMSYHTTLAPWAAEHAKWFNLWVFAIIISVILVLAMIIEFKIMLPSLIGFANVQGYIHENPFVQQLKEVQKELREVKTIVKSIEAHNER